MTWENVTSAFAYVTDIFTQCMTTITGNVVLMACLAGGLVSIGFRLFKKAKRAVK